MAASPLSSIGTAGYASVPGGTGPLADVASPASAAAAKTAAAASAQAQASGPTNAAGAGAGQADAASDSQLQQAIKKANEALSASNTQLVFVFDDQLHHNVVRLVDIQTQKVVQQLPLQDMPAAADNLSESPAGGALVNTKA